MIADRWVTTYYNVTRALDAKIEDGLLKNVSDHGDLFRVDMREYDS